MAHLLTTVARARRKRAFSRQSTDVVSDFLYAASAWVEGYCGRDFASAAHTEVLDGNDLPDIWVTHKPITAISAITITDEDGQESTVTPSTDIVYDAKTGRVSFGPNNVSDYDVWTRGKENVSITYTAGYSAAGYDGGNAPDDVQEATILRALCLYAESSSYQNAAFKSESLGEHSASRITSDDVARMMGQIRELLEPYRGMEVA